jgi:hypothetical protein
MCQPDTCREAGLTCYDVAAQIPKDTASFFDDCHSNEPGAVRLAEVLSAHLRNSGLLQ